MKIRAKYEILVCLDWSLRRIIVMIETKIALKMASNLWIFSFRNFAGGREKPLGHKGHSVHDIPCFEAVIDLPEIIVLKTSINEIIVNTKILFKGLPTVKICRILIYNYKE